MVGVHFGDALEEPSAGVGPIAVGGGAGDAEDIARLFDAEASKVAKFDELGFDGIEFGKGFEGFFEIE